MARIVDLSMTVDECESAPFAPDEKYFKLKPIIRWEDKGFVSNVVEMTVHVGTHIDSPHHFFRDKPSIEQLPLEPMMGQAVVLDVSAKGKARTAITPEDLDAAEAKLKQQGIEIKAGGMLFLRIGQCEAQLLPGQTAADLFQVGAGAGSRTFDLVAGLTPLGIKQAACQSFRVGLCSTRDRGEQNGEKDT